MTGTHTIAASSVLFQALNRQYARSFYAGTLSSGGSISPVTGSLGATQVTAFAADNLFTTIETVFVELPKVIFAADEETKEIEFSCNQLKARTRFSKETEIFLADRMTSVDYFTMPENFRGVVELPGNFHVVVGENDIEIKDARKKIIYHAETRREFNPHMNAADRLDEFMSAARARGLSVATIRALSIGAFADWLAIQAAKRDGETPPNIDDPFLLKIGSAA